MTLLDATNMSCAAEGRYTEAGLNSPESPTSSKAGRLWQKVKEKYHLVEYQALPEYLRDNEYILKYYRAEWPLKQTLLSMFTIHNETLNIWTSSFVEEQGLSLFHYLEECQILIEADLGLEKCWLHQVILGIRNASKPNVDSFLLPHPCLTKHSGNETRHLVGFILFLCLTIYTVVELPNLTRLPSLSKANFEKFQTHLLTSFPSMPALPSFSSWHLPEILSNCLPESLTTSNQSNQCVLQTMKEDMAKLVAPFLSPITRWPLFIFLGGAMFCLLSSTTCHLLSCISERMAYVMLRIDYAGIAALIAASFYPPVYYGFMCNPLWRNIYLIIITCTGVATILVSLLPVFQTSEYRRFRAALFFGMGFSGIAPILHKVFLHYDEPAALATTGYEIAMGLFYGVGALVYATRVPERWKPGLFDIAGHSHQLFHVLVVAGAYTHYQAGLLYLKWRDSTGCDA